MSSFLFLQGSASPFFDVLGRALKARGHTVTRIFFNPGDQLYWSHGGVAFRGRLAALPDFADDVMTRHDVTDLVLFGDCRSIHRPVIDRAEAAGLRVHVFEEGYFRPNRITLERFGVNRHSRLPRDPDWYLKAAALCPDEPTGCQMTKVFRARAYHDVRYHVAGLLNPVLYPHYRNHQIYNAPLEYSAYLWRFARLLVRRRQDKAAVQTLLGGGRTFFLLPLQLDGDAQIRNHSPFDGMSGVLCSVMRSFAEQADPSHWLVIKNHPLDPGVASHERQARRMADELGIRDRVVFLESGPLEELIKASRGVVTVNSTVGFVSLGLGCPTIALGESIYRLPGLTHQAGMRHFWSDPQPPDSRLFAAFERVVRHAAQVPGGFYCREGIAWAVENAVPRLEAERSVLEELLDAVG
ncbi:capsule biosynthesis protein [Guyparkeria sp. TX1]|uniref:capsule biosynthesis protein n=1 Tax=Guyparkeria sp. TX1 TaxID=3115001 RepID=UPI0039774703